MYTGDGSGDYCGILAAKSQQSHPQPPEDLAASERDPPAYVQQLQQQQPDQNVACASRRSLPSGSQPDNEHMQPQFINTLVEQQPEHEGSSRQQRWLPGQQQVQATQQQPVQLGGQQALVDGQQVPDERQHLQPQGQREDGRPSRQTTKFAGHKKMKQQGHSQQGAVLQRQSAVEDGVLQGGLGRGQGIMGRLECERVITWGHDKFEETQVFTIR